MTRFLNYFLYSKWPARRRRHCGGVGPVAAAAVVGGGAAAVAVALYDRPVIFGILIELL